MPIESRNYKDTVFKMLFNNKLYLLELYNAINGTSYTNPDDLEITTLEGETYLKMKNDLSFIIDFELNLFEHQASKCPNIPLRDLYYVAATYKDIIPQEKTYSSNPVRIPAPRFYMFYNGMSDLEDTVTYRLSELFQRPVEDPSIELVVTCLNVNEGHNKELMKACQTLNGYSKFVSKVRKYREKSITKYDETHSTPVKLLADNSEVMKGILAAAINTAIDECIKEDILKSFFIEYREEVTEVAIIEYSSERHIQYEKEESYNSGYDSGLNSGIKNTTDLFSWLFKNGRAKDVERATNDPEFLNKLFEEYSKNK
ncbi:hypothetical protein [Butyrivibrio sp. FCS006]|uniref:hypothetical protein n=1 Tax=Butyrivibrio sp. FCS006 TaxID=1280684 RepID=UPI000400B6A8|nr:hypothetical protein [Butyrivibrio sp. FCS006]